MKKNFNEYELENILGGKRQAAEVPEVKCSFVDNEGTISIEGDETPL